MFKTMFRKFKTLHPERLKDNFFEPNGILLNILNRVLDNLKKFALQRCKNVYCAKLFVYDIIKNEYVPELMYILRIFINIAK